MKKCTVLLLIIPILFAPQLFAQGYGGPLTVQGLDRHPLHSVAARAMGGVTVAVNNDIGSMFQHPASLHSLQKMQASLGGVQWSGDANQQQQYAPVRYYPNLSLLLEGLTAQIPNPDSMLVGFTAQDTVQRPFDDIGPDWSRSRHRTAPLHALLALPVSLAKVKIVAGIGAVEYADLDHYYQNNNVLTPDILSQRPLPTMRPTDDNPLPVEWSRTMRSRKGSIRGYGAAVAAGIGKYLSLGFSGLILQGSSDDFEQQLARGKLTFYSNAFRADSLYGRISKTGASDFSGREFTVSGILSGRYARFGLTVKCPTTITRSYSTKVETDETGTPELTAIKGTDELTLPWRGTIGLALIPRENLTLGLEYEWRPYDAAGYRHAEGGTSSPWLSASLLRAGIEYRAAPWLALRGGMRGEAEVFEPEGNRLPGEPVSYVVYSAGFGAFFAGATLNVTYENSLMKYQDIWSTAISKNSERRHILLAQLVYTMK